MPRPRKAGVTTAGSKDGLDLLESIAGTKSSLPKGNEPPRVIAPTDVVAKAIRDWNEFKREETNATAKRKAAEGAMRDVAEERRHACCLAAKQIIPSIRLVDPKSDQNVMFQQQRRWLKMVANAPISKENQTKQGDRLRAIFGDQFDRYFKIEPVLTVLLNGLTSNQINEISRVLCAMLGKNSKDVLKLELNVKPTNAFDLDCILKPETRQAWEEAMKFGLCQLAEPSFKQ